MKILFITSILAGGMLVLIISLDLIMGTTYEGIFWKAVNPFRVMESAEYIIILLFSLFFMIDSLGAYLKKKKEKSTNKN